MSNLPPIDASWWFCGWWLTQGFQRCFLQVFFFCRRFLIYLILANGGFPFPAPRKNNQTLQFNIHLNIGGINVTWDSEYSNLYCYKAEFLCHSFKNLKPINFNKKPLFYKKFILQKNDEGSSLIFLTSDLMEAVIGCFSAICDMKGCTIQTLGCCAVVAYASWRHIKDF